MSFYKYSLYALLLCSMGVQAGVYKWVDAEGRVHFSDRPVENAQEMLRYEKDVSHQAPNEKGSPAEEKESAGNETTGSYTTFELVQPENNQTFRTDEGTVPVGMLLQPGLQKGHEIQIIIDGNPIQGHTTTTQLMLEQVSRGTHQLHALVVDAEGKNQISSQKVTFHVRQGAKEKSDTNH
jgi:hypothetical protein